MLDNTWQWRTLNPNQWLIQSRQCLEISCNTSSTIRQHSRQCEPILNWDEPREWCKSGSDYAKLRLSTKAAIWFIFSVVFEILDSLQNQIYCAAPNAIELETWKTPKQWPCVTHIALNWTVLNGNGINTTCSELNDSISAKMRGSVQLFRSYFQANDPNRPEMFSKIGFEPVTS